MKITKDELLYKKIIRKFELAVGKKTAKVEYYCLIDNEFDEYESETIVLNEDDFTSQQIEDIYETITTETLK